MNPRGSIVCPSRPVQIGGATVTGRKPGIIVYLRASSTARMREFAHFCKVNGIFQAAVPGEGDDVRECLGTVESLERLATHPAVREWHLIVNARPPRFGGGVIRDAQTGVVQSPSPRTPADASAGVKDMLRTQRMGQSDRMAKGETERRKAYPAYRDFAECTEATRMEDATAEPYYGPALPGPDARPVTVPGPEPVRFPQAEAHTMPLAERQAWFRGE